MADDERPIGYTYEGYRLETKPRNHVVHIYECWATKEGKVPITGYGQSEDAAYTHAVLLINQEISRIGPR